MDEAMEAVQDAAVSQALVHFQSTLQAAVREVHVDVSAFKQRVEQRIEELCESNAPLAEAVSRLQEENQQLRAKLEALGRLVEGLTVLKTEKCPADFETDLLPENGHSQVEDKSQENHQPSSQIIIQSSSTASEIPGISGGSSHTTATVAAPGNSPAPPPWRTRRHTDVSGTDAKGEKTATTTGRQNGTQQPELEDLSTKPHLPLTTMTKAEASSEPRTSAGTSDGEEPQPHLPVTSMTSKHTPEETLPPAEAESEAELPFKRGHRCTYNRSFILYPL